MKIQKFQFKRAILMLSLFFYVHISFSQSIAEYYADAIGKEGYDLKNSLFQIIDGQTVRPYSNLWVLYRDSDAREDGTVYDMYTSCVYNFGPPDQDQGSGGNAECQHYNREHVVPRNWFGGTVSPMNEDAHHIPPVDKYVNALRANFPFGPVTNTSYTTTNGSLFGTSTFNGYNGQVFEPIDDYKGDFARMFLYMAVRYQNLAPQWKTNSTIANAVYDGSTDQVYSSWYLNILIEWHLQDPPDHKDSLRNEKVYAYQGNRNPFIDYPEFVECIWRNICQDNDDGGGEDDEEEDEEVVLSTTIAHKTHEFILYPNPAIGQLFIESKHEVHYVEIYDTHGKKMYRGKMNEESMIDISSLEGGLYILQLTTNKGIKQLKFVKK